ncbi:hypothetical protein GGR51DRAFT_259049 [Nemania sp. FL0031]|nr:hypothetical protein GGR51DRAFT_259049 [Nemania sp. FL0031]
MSPALSRSIKRVFRRKDGSKRSKRNPDLARPTTEQGGLQQFTHLPNIPILPRSIAPTADTIRTAPNTITQDSAQNSSQQPIISTRGQSPIQLDLWKEAIATLSKDDKASVELLIGDASMPVQDVVNKMIAIAAKWQELCEKSRSSTVRLNGHKISPSETASRVITWLNKFKEIGDLIVQYDTTHASLPWAVVRFFLQAVIISRDEMAASLDVMESVTRIIHRCRVFEELYNRKTIQHPIIENLESALICLYSSVLQGLVKTNEFLSRRLPDRVFYAILHPTRGSGLLANLKQGEDLVEREIVACEGQLRVKADAGFQEQLHSLLELKEPVLRADKNIKEVLQQLDEIELIEILKWVSPIEFRKHHDIIKELRTKDTCEWLLQRSKFSQWSSATSSITLWLQGFPGSGKTYLISRVVDKIEETLTKRDNDESFAFFYCNRNEENRRNALDILRSYVRQLSTTPRMPGHIYTQLKQLYASSSLKGSGWTLGFCQEYLVELLNLFPRTTFVLDALDECKPEERTILLDFFDSIPSKSPKPVRIFISSRPEGDIRQRLIHLSNIEIQATDNEYDISKFVMQSIEKNGRWSETLRKNKALKENIIQTLLDQSNGMFQWVMLQIKQLLNLRTEHEITSRLGKLPQDLKAAYDEIYENIEGLEPHARALSLRALKWITCAYRPLPSVTLLAAISGDLENAPECFETTEADILDWCANLIRIDYQQEPPAWRVSHLSVVEYLENRWPVLEAHCFVAKASLVLLQATYGGDHGLESEPDSESESEVGDIFFSRHPLRVYTQYYWILHVQALEHEDPDPELAALLKAFLGSPGKSSMQYRRWHREIVCDDRSSVSPSPFSRRNFQCIFPSTSSIFLACRFPLYTILSDWWDTVPIELSQLTDSGDDLLSLAVAGGSRSICTKLCDIGISVNKPLRIKDWDGTDSGGSALAVAVQTAQADIIQLLVDKGADVNMPLEGQYSSVLDVAVCYAHVDIIQLLVNNGADLNMPLKNSYGSALGAAASCGETNIVQLLIDHGADVNMPLEAQYGSALGVAINYAHENIIQLLIDNGADINMPLGIMYGSALGVAVTCGKADIVRLLIDHGADVNMPLGDFNGSALGIAVRCARSNIIQLLIDNGADVNMILFYGSALGVAVTCRHADIIQLLIDNGADINMPLQSNLYPSALGIAVYCSRSNIIQLLIDNGADVNMPLGNFNGSALVMAVYRGNGDIIQLLIDNGANVNMPLQSGIRPSALTAAIDKGSTETVQLLINNGADVNMLLQSDFYSSALSKHRIPRGIRRLLRVA